MTNAANGEFIIFNLIHFNFIYIVFLLSRTYFKQKEKAKNIIIQELQTNQKGRQLAVDLPHLHRLRSLYYSK